MELNCLFPDSFCNYIVYGQNIMFMNLSILAYKIKF